MTPIEEIEDTISRMQDINLKAACRALIQDAQFLIWPAAIGMHHAYPGGLLTHTCEVLRYAHRAADGFAKVNRDVLTAACLWHDYAKVFEYEVVTLKGTHSAPEKSLVKERRGDSFGETEYWIRSDYLQKIGHIAGSTTVFYHTAVMRDVRSDVLAAVCHCILSHHGPVREWGSPVAPQSLEAHLLHHADMLSAKFGATKDKAP